MTVVSAARKEFGQRRLRQRRAAQGECELAVQDLFHVASSRNPADAIPWRDRLGEGAAVDRVAMRIQGYEWLRTLFTEVDIAIDVVLDQRNPVPREQFQDGLLLLVGHGATQWVVEARRQQTRFDRRRSERSSQGREVDAATRVGRQ